jgi:predicted Zn-dependent protease
MRRACQRPALALAALTALACGDIAEPLRNDLYEWRLIVPSGATADTVHFHWPRAELPVRVWVEPAGNLPELMQRAIDTWESVYLYREFQARLVSDSTGADVLVRATPAPANARLAVTRLESALAPECSGATDLDVSQDLSQLRLPIRIYIEPVSGDLPNLQRCLGLTTIHELGHALGIFAHSPNSTDIMYADPTVEQPSQLDRGTAEALYHLPPTLTTVRPD